MPEVARKNFIFMDSGAGRAMLDLGLMHCIPQNVHKLESWQRGAFGFLVVIHRSRLFRGNLEDRQIGIFLMHKSFLRITSVIE